MLCHELAHFYLNHVNIAIAQHINKLNSKDVGIRFSNLQMVKYKTTAHSKSHLSYAEFR